MPNDSSNESFQEFKNSFSYGSRTDLNFKFLAGLADDDAAKFFQDLLCKLGDSFDDGQYGRLLEHVYQWQAQAYSGAGRTAYDDGPFTPLRKPASESRLALLTSTGHFVAGDDPEPFGVKQMTQSEATERIMEFVKSEPELSFIPVDTPRESLRVRHGGYDVRGAQADPNVAFPIERLQELAKEGLIGDLAPTAYSFIGACAQSRLLKRAAPQWVKMLQEQEIDAVLLVPV